MNPKGYILCRSGSEWSVQIERTTPTHLDAVPLRLSGASWRPPGAAGQARAGAACLGRAAARGGQRRVEARASSPALGRTGGVLRAERGRGGSGARRDETRRGGGAGTTAARPDGAAAHGGASYGGARRSGELGSRRPASAEERGAGGAWPAAADKGGGAARRVCSASGGRLGRSSTPAQEHGGGAALGVRNRGRR